MLAMMVSRIKAVEVAFVDGAWPGGFCVRPCEIFA